MPERRVTGCPYCRPRVGGDSSQRQPAPARLGAGSDETIRLWSGHAIALRSMGRLCSAVPNGGLTLEIIRCIKGYAAREVFHLARTVPGVPRYRSRRGSEDSRRIAPAGVLRRRGPDTTTPRWLAAAGRRRANIPLMLRAAATQAGRVSVREIEALLTRAGGTSRLPRRFRFLGCVGRYGQDALAP